MTPHRTSSPWPLIALIAAQAVCLAVFLWDAVLDGGRLGALWPLDWHFMVEAGAVLGLAAGIVVEMVVLMRMLARQDRLQHQVTMASAAFHDVIDAHFGRWGLTASESDVAWFTVKGLGIAEIAALRGTAEGTVKSHLNAIYRKSGAGGRGELLSLLLDDLMADPARADRARADRAGTPRAADAVQAAGR
jgi:DNA-binding CsgD family transcriptional regulator